MISFVACLTFKHNIFLTVVLQKRPTIGKKWDDWNQQSVGPLKVWFYLSSNVKTFTSVSLIMHIFDTPAVAFVKHTAKLLLAGKPGD